MLTRPALPLAAAALLLSLTACGGGSSSETAADPGSSSSPSDSGSSSSTGSNVSCDYPSDPQAATRKVDPPPQTPDVSGKVAVTIKSSIGTLDVTLDADKTPCTVNSFVSLAKQGFFDDTPCHRLTTVNIYVLQCGDPSGTGTGGPGYTIPDELSGKETYGPGTLAMANTNQPDTGGSQFFIVYKATPLPPSYTVFGQMDPAGVKLVQKIAKQGTDNAYAQGDGHPTVNVTLESVTAG